MKFKSYVSGPRWANLKKALFVGADIHDLDLTILHHDKGWIRETIYFQVEGVAEDVEEFTKQLEEALNEYNSK